VLAHEEWQNSLLQQLRSILITVHPRQVLFEIIQTWPHLVFARAILSKAHIYDFGATHRLFFVDTFLMSGQIIDGTETLSAGTVWFIAFEQFLMSCFVFPVHSTYQSENSLTFSRE